MTLEELARRCEEVTDTDRQVEHDIAAAVGYQGFDVPAYMRSLDAAMTLVPEGMDWGIAHFGPRGSEAQIWPHGARDSAEKTCGSSVNVPLCLCAAALRAQAAIASQQTTEGE